MIRLTVMAMMGYLSVVARGWQVWQVWQVCDGLRLKFSYAVSGNHGHWVQKG